MAKGTRAPQCLITSNHGAPLYPAEAICARTANAAHTLGAEDLGRLAPGYRADMLLLDAPNWRHVAYHLSGYRFAMRIESGWVL